MKMRYFAALIVAVALVLGGCYVATDEGAGTVGVELPGSDDPDQTVVEPADAAQTARVYLLNGNQLVDLTDDGYLQVDLVEDDEEITVGPVPAGPGYQIILLLGAADGASFDASKYAVSESFTVFAGQANEIPTMDAYPVDFATTTIPGEDLVGIIADGTAYYAASATELFVGDAALSFGAGEAVADALPGVTVNSLSLGAFYSGTSFAFEPWLNTTDGILPYRDGAFDTDFSTELAEGTSILSSGAFGVGLGTERNLYAFFQLNGGLGGLWVPDTYNSTPEEWEWLDAVDLEDLVTGPPVYDFVLNGLDAVYFATKLGNFRFTATSLEALLNAEGEPSVQDVLDEAEFFTVSVNEQEVDVTGLALVGDTMYLATPKGVIEGTTVDSDDVISVTDDAVIPATANREVLAMEFSGNYGAILTDHFLIVTNDREDYTALPLYLSDAGTPNDIFLDPVSGRVLVASSDGLLAVDIDAAVE